VDPAVWRRFVTDERAAERKRRKLDNAIRLKDRPGHAVEVIASDHCLQVMAIIHRVALHELKGAWPVSVHPVAFGRCDGGNGLVDDRHG
jgi:hypothetical protein